MNSSDIDAALRDAAPPELAYEGEELGFIWGPAVRDVMRLGVTWRPTAPVLRQSIDLGIDMLVIHEPLFQAKKSTVIPDSELTYPPNSLRRSLLDKGGFSVYRAHSNWDDADEGNNEILTRVLELFVIGRIPYGRIGTCRPMSLASLANHVKTKLGCRHVLVTGNLDRRIETVAVVSGSGNSLTEMIEISKQRNADVLVSGDIQDSRARFAAELDLALIDAGGYYTESPGMKHLADLLSSSLIGLEVHYLDPGPPWQVS